MLIYPAIDLRHGQVVRLRQGERDQTTVYGNDPLATARKFLEHGAQWLHVIDLDGAFADKKSNRVLIKQMAQTLACRVQSGGGIRTLDDIAELLEAGVARVILGTVAVRNPEVVELAIKKFSASAIAVAIDTRDGRVAIEGWEKGGEVEAITFAQRLQTLGVELVIHTDIARDGMLSGVNFSALREILERTDLRVIASGGVRDLDDIKQLHALKHSRLEGVIVGRALYEGTIQLVEAIRWIDGSLD
jgi:phosphoribosylformimino-5-aminoimidazole carboxamide ribotide isomerase